MAFLKKRGNRWYACFFQQGRKIVKATGIQCQSEKAPPSRLKKLAQEIADNMERVAKGKTELSRAMESLRSLARDIGFSERVGTMQDYFRSHVRPDCRFIVDSFLDYLASSRITRIDEITPSDITAYLSSFAGKLAAGSITKYKVTIGSVFRAAVNDSLITRNPCAVAKLPAALAAPHMERKAFTLEELHALILAMPAPWPAVIRLTYLAGGLRLGDVCLLRWGDIDLAAGQITLTPRKTRKTGKRLLIPITPPLLALLQELPRSGEYVFPKLASSFLADRSVPAAFFVSWVKKLGMAQTTKQGARNFSQLSFHSIRHTVVTQLRAAGVVAPDVVRSIVGHASETVERGYFHAPAAARMEGYDFLARQLEK